MPKGKKKYKSGGLLHSKLDLNALASEDSSVADNCSVISNISELHAGSDDETVDLEDEAVVFDDFEDKIKEAIDGTFQKSAKGRQTCLETIRKALTSKYMFDFIMDRKMTMSEMVERILKRGKGEEQAIAAVVAALICVQLGAVEESEVVFKGFHPLLIVILADPSVSPSIRAQCATSLGLCCFVSCTGNEVIQSTMESLYSVFSASFFKGNGVAPLHKPEITLLHSTALLAWCLLLTVLPPPYIVDLINKHFRRLPELLDSVDLELRIAAGETIAVFYELARQCHENSIEEEIDDLCVKLRQLATDSQKFRAKKDRRQQRSSFRDVLKAIEENEPPDIRVKFGREVLYIDSWCHKRQYDAFCQLLGSGMNFHLMENEILREIFELGAPLNYAEKPSPKNSKLERHIANIASSKARTKSRSKLRDKRADVIQ